MENVRDLTAAFIEKNPGVSYSKFLKMSNIKVSDCYYYSIRKQISNTAAPKEKRSYHKSGSNIFVNLTSIPAKDLSDQTKNILFEVIKSINFVKRTRIEIIENLKDNTLEFREPGF